MISFLVATVYFLLSLLVTTITTRTAFAMSVGFVLALYAAIHFTESKSLLSALRWFRSYPFRGGVVFLVCAVVAVLGANASVPLGQVIQSIPMCFAWFWAFSAAGTFIDEHRLRKAVRRALETESASVKKAS